jgi:hypothetical protein
LPVQEIMVLGAISVNYFCWVVVCWYRWCEGLFFLQTGGRKELEDKLAVHPRDGI